MGLLSCHIPILYMNLNGIMHDAIVNKFANVLLYFIYCKFIKRIRNI